MIRRLQSRRPKPAKPAPKPRAGTRKPLAPSGRRGAPKRRRLSFGDLIRLAADPRLAVGPVPRVSVAMTSPTKQDRYRARAEKLEIVRDALEQQAIARRGLTKEEAKAEMADLLKRRDAMDNALVAWAWWYLKGEELQKVR